MQKGFTLVESIMVLTIMMILASIGYVASISLLRSQALSDNTSLVVSQIMVVQNKAYTQEDDLDHGLKLFEDSVVLFVGSSYLLRDQSKDVMVPLPAVVGLSGDDEIVFKAGTLNPTAPILIQLTHNNKTFDLSVSAYGVLAVEKGSL